MKLDRIIPQIFGTGLLTVALAALSVAAQSPDSVRSRLTLRANVDYGHLVNGTNPNPSEGSSSQLSMLPLNRTGFLAIQEVGVGRFDVQAGLSGLIWWPFGGSTTDASERVMNVKPSVPVARVRWQFGGQGAAASSVQIGTFPYKYNPDAKNLGEYLYRSGTYPGYLFTTEGWLLMNRASNYSHGALLTLTQLDGKLKHNFSMFMETQYYSVGDFSPGYDVAFTSKWLDLGAGAVFHHYLPLHPSSVRPHGGDNTYVHASIDTGSGASLDTIDFYGPASAFSIYTPDPTFRSDTLHRWTHQGVKLMGRAALNLNSLLPLDMRNPDDLRIFAEVAVLGWKNQPLYYEKRTDRIPIMFGINVPTFKLLDVLTLQGEYYASPFNDIDRYNSSSLPIWNTPFEQTFDSTLFSDVPSRDADGQVIPSAKNHDDDWKWSVYGKKTINKVISVHAQAASDHLRLTTGPQTLRMSNVPLTGKPTEWYYLLRFDFALR